MNWDLRTMEGWQNWANAATAVVTPLALIVTVITLIVTSMASQDQLRVAALSYQRSMVYQALKDTREIATLYHDGKASESAVFATMQGVFVQQYKLDDVPGGIDEVWGVFDNDFCMFMRDEHLQNSWDQENHKHYWIRFVEYMDDVLKRAKNACQ